MPRRKREEIRAVILDCGGVVRATKHALLPPVEEALKTIGVDSKPIGLTVPVFYQFRQLGRFQSARDAIAALWAINQTKETLDDILARGADSAVTRIHGLMALNSIPEEDLSKAHARHSEVLHELRKDMPAVEGAPAAIERLKRLGLRLAIATNENGKRTREWLRRKGLLERFDIVLGAEEVQNRKPHPELINRIRDRLKLKPKQIIVVGDRPTDIEAGRNARVRQVVGVVSGVGLQRQLLKAGANSVHINLEYFVRYLVQQRRGKTGRYYRL